MLDCDEHAAHFGLRERRRMERNMGCEYAEKMSRLGESVGAEEGCCVRILMASSAWRTPITPTTGPRIPPSPQDTTDSGGGGRGNMQR
jgi:hypothetical protein